MSKKLKASGIMTRMVVVANTANKFGQVMEFFSKHNVQHLPVTSGDELVGIISLKDMNNYLQQKLAAGGAMNMGTLDASFNLSEVMTPKPVRVDVDDTFEKVVEILGEGKFQALPVVKDGLIHGIITNKDVVRIYKWALEN
jgi:acetoin utilization protein AcuB